MGQIVLDFSTFINEHKRFEETLTWSKEYAAVFSDFPFENGIIELVDAMEKKWIELKNKYNWNRESRNFRSDHFAIDVKVYIWPDEEKTKEALGYPELSEEEMYRWWYQFLNDQREALADGIDYEWVKDVGFGGKSGGWLVIVPITTDDDQAESCEESLQSYKDAKLQIIDIDPEAYRNCIGYSHDENYAELVKTGMITEPEGIVELRKDADRIKNSFTASLEELNSIDLNIRAILAQVEKFRKNGLTWFYDYLRDESSYLSE